MNNDSQRYQNRLLLVIDAALIIFSYVLAWFVRVRVSMFGLDIGVLSFEYYMSFLFIIVPLYLLFNYAFGLYAARRIVGRRAEAYAVFRTNTVGVLVVILLLYMIRQIDFARSILVIFYVLNMFLDIFVRSIVRYVGRRLRRSEANLKTVLLVGYSDSATEFIDRALAFPDWGYEVTGILDDEKDGETQYKGIKVIGPISSLPQVLEEGKTDEIAITLDLSRYYLLQQIVAVCEKYGVHTMFIPDYYNIIPSRPYTEDLLGLPVVNIRYVPLNNNFLASAKRLADIIGSLLCMVIFSPAMLFVVIGTKMTSKGSLIFSQIRVGLHNREFRMYKFRSMTVQSDEEEKEGWTTKDDARITKFGALIRRTSLDELPQLLNVLKGDMSLVGPRPERPQFVEKFRETIPRYMIKHQVRPGMTGWAQVNGYRGDTSIRKRIDFDLYYIENWSFGLDLKILFLTVFKGFANKNAY